MVKKEWLPKIDPLERLFHIADLQNPDSKVSRLIEQYKDYNLVDFLNKINNEESN